LQARQFVSGLSDTAFEQENDSTSEPKMNNVEHWCGRFVAACLSSISTPPRLYDIIRQCGVEIGKRDFMGAPPS